MNPSLDLQGIRHTIANYVAQASLDERVLNTLLLAGGFVPKEAEFWDYKAVAGTDALSIAKTVLQVVSFHNAYGGYIIYGVEETENREFYIPRGIRPGAVNEQQVKALIENYTGEAIDVSYREIRIFLAGQDLLFGLLHIPKRSSRATPVFFGRNGPDAKPGAPLFRKEEAYVRLQDTCVPARDKKALQFLFGPRETEIFAPEHQIRPAATNKSVPDHNLPDRTAICSRFFGRNDILDRLWLWLSDDFSHTRILAGDGGKGKTSIAYEFSEEVCCARPYDLQRVFWVTAKSRRFIGLENTDVQVPETHFYDLPSLLHTLCLGYAMREEEVEKASIIYLKKSLQNALNLFPSLVVVDDIDSVADLDEQKRILEAALQVCAGTPSRFLLTTRMNLTSSTDICITVPGFRQDEYGPYLDYLGDTIGGISINKHQAEALWNATEGSPLFTESIFRLCRQGMALKEAIKQWKGKLGEEVRMAALHREVSKLSPEARRVLLACALMREAASVELRQVTGYDDVRMTGCLDELQSLFLIAAPRIIRDVRRFSVPTNTARLVLEREGDLVADPSSLKKTILSLRTRGRSQRISQVGKVISQGRALLQEEQFDPAIQTIHTAMKKYPGNYDLLLMLGSCHLQKSKHDNDRYNNDEARRLFKQAYEKGQRKDLLYDIWFESEVEAQHANGALEVCELAIKDGSGRRTEWLRRRANSLFALSRGQVEAGHPDEAQKNLRRCANDLRRVMAGEHVFNDYPIRSTLEKVNAQRRMLATREARDFDGWENAVISIMEIIHDGDDTVDSVHGAVDAFGKLVASVIEKGEVWTRHIAACQNRHRQVASAVLRCQQLPKEERGVLLSKLGGWMDDVKNLRIVKRAK